MTNSYSSLLASLVSHKAAATDLAKCIDQSNIKYGFSEKTFTAGNAYEIDWVLVFSLPQKQIMRAVQFVNALSTGAYKNFDYTHARILCAMKLAGSYDLNTDAIIALAGATRNPAANTRGISTSALNAMFSSAHGASTVQTKMSNSTGKNGIFQAIGLTFASPGEQNHTVSLNTESPIAVRFFELINRATTGQIEELVTGK